MKTKSTVVVLTAMFVINLFSGLTAMGQVQATVSFYANRAPVSVGSTTQVDVVDYPNSGSFLAERFEQGRLWLNNQAFISNPAQRQALVMADETGNLPAEWLMAIRKSDPVGLWLGVFEPDNGSIGTASTITYRVVLPQGQTTTGRKVHRAFRLDSNVSRWSGFYPLRNGNGILGTNDRRNWITSLGPDGVRGGGDDVTTTNPDAPIVAFDYEGFQVRFLLPSLDQNGIDSIRNAVEDLPFWIRPSFDGLVTDQGLPIVGSRVFSSGPLVPPTTMIMDGQVVVGDTKPYQCYEVETSTSLGVGSWTPATMTPNLTGFSFPISVGSEPRRFWRIGYGYCDPLAPTMAAMVAAAKSTRAQKALDLLNKQAR